MGAAKNLKNLNKVFGTVGLGVCLVLMLGQQVFGQAISPNRTLALKIYKRITGSSLPIDHPKILEMESHIYRGQLMAAAGIAVNDPKFLNITIKSIGAPLSTKDGEVTANFNDFMAMFMGVARDGISAKEMLTGDFWYRGNPSIVTRNSDLLADILGNNSHYSDMEGRHYDLQKVLIKIEGQVAVQRKNNERSVVPHPNPSGIITSQAFLRAHASGGTNRRIVEKLFDKFLCTPIGQLADASVPADMIGRDVDRAPGGNTTEFKTSCQSCHTQMDSLRNVFSKMDADANEQGEVYWSDIYESNLFNGNRRDSDGNYIDSVRTIAGVQVNGIATKMNRTANEDQNLGFITPMNYTTFKLRSNDNANHDRFGWRDPAGSRYPKGAEPTGTSIKELGQLIADSEQFSRCMVDRMFKQVCNRSVASDEKAMVQDLAIAFEKGGYRFKELAQRVAITPECMGEGE